MEQPEEEEEEEGQRDEVESGRRAEVFSDEEQEWVEDLFPAGFHKCCHKYVQYRKQRI